MRHHQIDTRNTARLITRGNATRNHERAAAVRNLRANAPHRKLAACFKRLCIEIHAIHSLAVCRLAVRETQAPEHIRGLAVARQRSERRRGGPKREHAAGGLPRSARRVADERDGTRCIGQLQHQRAIHRGTRHVDDALQACRLRKIRRQRHALPLLRIGTIAQDEVVCVRLHVEVGRARQTVDVAVEAHQLPRAPIVKLLGDGQVRLVVISRVHTLAQVGAVAGQFAARLHAHDRLAAREVLGLLHRQARLAVAEVAPFGHLGAHVAQRDSRRALGHEVALHLHSVARIAHRRDGRSGVLRAVHRSVATRGAQALVALVVHGRTLHERRQLFSRLRLVALDVRFAHAGQHRRRAGHCGRRHRRALLVPIGHQIAAQADAVNRQRCRNGAARLMSAALHRHLDHLIVDLYLELLPVNIFGKFRRKARPRIATDAERRARHGSKFRRTRLTHFGVVSLLHQNDSLTEHKRVRCVGGRRGADAEIARLLGRTGKIDGIARHHVERVVVGNRIVAQFKRSVSVEALAVLAHLDRRSSGFRGERKVGAAHGMSIVAIGIRHPRLPFPKGSARMAFIVETLIQHGFFVFLAKVVRAIGPTRLVGGPRG